MRFRVSSRRAFTPERWGIFDFHMGRGIMRTPEIFRGTGDGGAFSSHAEAMQAVQNAFETPGALSDAFKAATRGHTFVPMRIDLGYTNGILDAVRLGALG